MVSINLMLDDDGHQEHPLMMVKATHAHSCPSTTPLRKIPTSRALQRRSTLLQLRLGDIGVFVGIGHDVNVRNTVSRNVRISRMAKTNTSITMSAIMIASYMRLFFRELNRKSCTRLRGTIAGNNWIVRIFQSMSLLSNNSESHNKGEWL